MAASKNGKYMFYEADLDYRKIKYVNDKKKPKMEADFERKLGLYPHDKFDIKEYTL